MTEPIEGKPETGGPDAKPAPSAQSAQPSAEDYAKVIPELQRKMAEQDAVIRSLQSGKDKRWESEVKPLQDQVARLAEALGVDEKQVKDAQRKLALDDLAEAYMDESQSEPSSDGTGDGKDNSAELQTISAALELPANDPRVTDLKLKYGNDVAKFSVEASILKQSLVTAQPTPAEQLPPGTKSSTPGPETDDQKRERLFGNQGNIFDEQFAKEHGGGVFIRK